MPVIAHWPSLVAMGPTVTGAVPPVGPVTITTDVVTGPDDPELAVVGADVDGGTVVGGTVVGGTVVGRTVAGVALVGAVVVACEAPPVVAVAGATVDTGPVPAVVEGPIAPPPPPEPAEGPGDEAVGDDPPTGAELVTVVAGWVVLDAVAGSSPPGSTPGDAAGSPTVNVAT
jgi:hypothetical protein